MRTFGLLTILGFVAGVQGACVGDADDGRTVSPEELADLTCEADSCDVNETCIVEGDAMGCVCEGDFHRDEEGTCVSDTTLTSCTPSGIDCTNDQPVGFEVSCDPVEGCSYLCPSDRCEIGDLCISAATAALDNPCQTCQPDLSRDSYSPSVGRACDDGDACTFGDVCTDEGVCAGTSVVCEDDPSTCGAERSCNGSAACTVSYPDAGTGCDDGLSCTFDDACDGAGACLGTEIRCDDDPGVCGAIRSCNGTALCDVSFPGTDAICDDSDLCTYGDRCDGAGVCQGNAIVCEDDSAVCGATSTCNGTSECSLTYTEAGFACDDGNACTLGDQCDGAGACQSGNGVDCGPGGVCSLTGCTCLEGYTGAACRECDVGYVPEGDNCIEEPEPLPNFALVDINSASPTFNQTVRFEDFRGRISAWYFFHST